MEGAHISSTPLTGLSVVERYGSRSSDVSCLAVAFAGMLASRLGARVFRRGSSGHDPIRHRGPCFLDGSSAVFAFLTSGKTLQEEGEASEPAAILLTDDPDIAKRSSASARILIVPSAEDSRARPQSELTLQAAAGLLDIIGNPGRPPLALPGFQVAYSSGLAAFDGLLALHLAAMRGLPLQSAEIRMVEVAAWVNWKHQLDRMNGVADAGIRRSEEWRVIPCGDGYVALVFRDVDMANLARLAGDPRLLGPEFKTKSLRAKRLEEFLDIVRAAFRTRQRDEIIAQARELRLPLAPVLAAAEVLNDPQYEYRNFVVQDATGNSLRLPVTRHGA